MTVKGSPYSVTEQVEVLAKASATRTPYEVHCLVDGGVVHAEVVAGLVGDACGTWGRR